MIAQENQALEPINHTLPELKHEPRFDIFTRYGEVNSQLLYVRYFSKIPNFLDVPEIDPEDYRKFFKKEYADQILKEFFSQSIGAKDKLKFNDHIFIFSEEIVVNIEGNSVTILCENTEAALVQKILADLKEFRKKKKKKAEICLIVSSHSELDTRKIKFKKPDISLSENYNDGFVDFHKKIQQQLKKKNESGLFLFHGKPGTGKSTYIRYLIKKVRKKAIFMSPKMAGSLDQVAMTKLLLDNRNCILIVEDAEELVLSRDSGRNSNLSMILNLTDGILGESLGIQIIATFNTELKNIDPALMRKGRLKASYEFAELSVEKTNALLQKQGLDLEMNKPLCLADIFNYAEENQHVGPMRKAVGFRN